MVSFFSPQHFFFFVLLLPSSFLSQHPFFAAFLFGFPWWCLLVYGVGLVSYFHFTFSKMSSVSGNGEKGANSLGCMQCLQCVFSDPLHLEHVCDRVYRADDGAFTVCTYCADMGKPCEDVSYPRLLLLSLLSFA